MRAGIAALGGTLPAWSERFGVPSSEPDYKLDIGGYTFEVAPKKFLKTIAYNQQVPGPLLRMKRGQSVTVDVTNRTSHPEVVHWHGLGLAPALDGAMEEGTPMIAPGATTRLRFTPDEPGLRWYHTHTMAGADFGLGQYTGLHGMLIVDEAGSASYDRELTLVLHDWDGRMEGGDDGTMQATYKYSTINGRVEGFGEPLRVKQGERALFQILNASATEVHWLAFAGHTFQVIAMDGNALATPIEASMLRLAPAERITAMVTMNHPGRWVLAEPRKHVRAAGMGIALEYEGAAGAAKWEQPDDLHWEYADFAESNAAAEGASPEVIPVVIESKFRGHGAPEVWLLNGASYPQPNAPVLQAGKRYRLRFDNRSTDDHPIHLHRHIFRVTSIAGKALLGPLKDTVLVNAKTVVDVDFTANNPGLSLLHCHQQDHMDRGFMMVLRYA